MSNSGTTLTKAALTLPLTISHKRKQIKLNKQTQYGKQAVFYMANTQSYHNEKKTSMVDKLPRKKKSCSIMPFFTMSSFIPT